MLLEVGDQRCRCWRAPRAAERVHLKRDVLEPEVVHRRAASDQFGIGIRAGETERLHADLVELAVAPFCGRSWRNIGP